LRNTLALRDEDLAAMGCSQTQSSQILASLVNWLGTNASNWTQAEAAQQSADSALAVAQTQINIGPASDTVLTSYTGLQQNLATAQQALATLVQGAGTTVSTQLSSDQQQIWQAASANAALGVPSRYRYAQGLSSQDAHALILAAYRGQSGDSVLSNTELQTTIAAQQNQSASTAGVLSAEATIVPPPANLGQKTSSSTK
jgi:hypothetical protein